MMEEEVGAAKEEEVPVTGTMQIGVSRPPLPLEDLPTPEEVFEIKGKLTPGKVVRYVLGPSMIALGISIGSGEWLVGPRTVGGAGGFIGLGWVVLASALLQVFYNVELGRFTVATGEAPVVAFGRVPPGFLLWTPLAVFLFYLSFIWGGWAANAGESLFPLIFGRARTTNELVIVKELGVLLLFVIFGITLFGKKISRTLEIANWIMVVFILVSVTIIAIVVVPAAVWGNSFASLVIPAAPPKGTSATLLGALAGFTALAAGLNYVAINYYRDKGYGMGHRVGYIAGAIGGKQEKVLPSGLTFPETPKNIGLWKRWWRYLLIDQWGVFFVGAVFGMMLPTMIVYQLVQTSGVRPTDLTIPTFAADQLGLQFGPFLRTWALLVGFFILFSTQLGIFDLLSRQVVDGGHAISARFRRLTEDPRRFYYPFLLVLAGAISGFLFLLPPFRLITVSANFANLPSMIMPFAVIYLNRRLPKVARLRWWSYIVLLLNVVFFGFFFINFAFSEFTGKALVTW
ncbi:MAG TPA: Nramp family divalent metal transporter [Thermoplasmata archaeon]|nr:Nramp family divalent metal transporter [Thermoplasmata archaeon]